MCAIMDFKAESHILFHHFELVHLFQLLVIVALSDRQRSVDTLQEGVFHLYSVAVLGVRKEHSHVLVRGKDSIRLN